MKNIIKILFVSKIRYLMRKVSWRRKNIFIAKGSYIHKGVTIGEGTRINNISHIGESDIGCYCAIGGRLVIRSTNHSVEYLNMQDYLQNNTLGSHVEVAGKSKGKVSIGHGVWIGDSVIILPGVTVGNGAVIGAGSVVTKPIPDYAVAVGNPARVMRYRFSKDILNILKDVRWWEWSPNKMKANINLFETNLAKISAKELESILKEKQ